MNIDNPVISVVMSVYNSEQYLEEAIESILNQTLSNFEFIIVNDGSTDNSISIIKSYMETDNRIVMIDRKNKGLPYSLNEGVAKAKGEYIARMDADDKAFKNRLEHQLNYMLANADIDLSYFDTVFIDKNSKIVCPSWRPKKVEKVLSCLKEHNFIPHPTVMFKKSVFENVGGYDESFRTGQDLNLWLRMKEEKYNFGYIDKALLYYRLNPTSVRAYLSDYWYSVATRCISNGHRFKAYKYFPLLTWRKKAILLIKSVLPFSYFLGKYK